MPSLSLLSTLAFLFTAVACQDPSELSGLSIPTLQGLQEASQRVVDMATVQTFSISAIITWIAVYICSKLTWRILSRSYRFRQMEFDNQRTSVIYVLNIVFTTLILGLQLASTSVLVAEYRSADMFRIEFMSSILAVLYLFELTYRSKMRLPMLCHHFATLFAVSFGMYSFQTARDPSMITTGYLWIFQASTEQMIFVGLLMYRLKITPRITIFCLRFGAVQAIIFKFASSTWILVWWGLKQSRHTSSMEIAYSVVIVVANAGLAVTQVYGSWIVWKISCIYAKKYADEMALRTSATNTIIGEDEEKFGEKKASSSNGIDEISYAPELCSV